MEAKKLLTQNIKDCQLSISFAFLSSMFIIVPEMTNRTPSFEVRAIAIHRCMIQMSHSEGEALRFIIELDLIPNSNPIPKVLLTLSLATARAMAVLTSPVSGFFDFECDGIPIRRIVFGIHGHNFGTQHWEIKKPGFPPAVG